MFGQPYALLLLVFLGHESEINFRRVE